MSINFLKNSAFCALPFISRFQDTSGEQHLCCYSRSQVDYSNRSQIQQLRSDLLSGKKIDHCQSCYLVEEQGAISPRLKESARWLRDPEVRNYISSWSETSEEKVWFYDLRYDNKCNLACIMCGPRNSTLWQRELNQTISKSAVPWSQEQVLRAKKIYMAGGEPLIIDSFIELLQEIAKIDQQPEVVINTNLTSLSEDVQSTLSKLHQLTLTVSVDAYGAVNEYHRWPLKWEKFVRNLEWARSIKCSILFNTVVDAVSILGIPKLIEIESFADYWDLDILTDPLELSVINLPDSVKSKVKLDWKNLEKSKFYQTDVVFRSRVNTVLAMLDKFGDPDKLSNYIDSIDKRRNLDHTKFLGIKLT